MWLIWLFRTQPIAQMVEYLAVDEHGLKYVHASGKKSRTSRYAWSEIQSAIALLGSKGEEVQGLSVVTNRKAHGGTPILLPVFSEKDCVAVVRLINEQLEIQKLATQHGA
ncbi:MAG: hypothetical protein EOP84_26310 [Verrucomicrobiaceae bacterium]|nr:MAG: hypothetical protein EOP84_26310 [Verrucomicrobiaceae bacterium]